jgi:hypothetical protein
MSEPHTMPLTPMGLHSVKEPWGEAVLEDGTRVRFRVIVRGVQRVEGSVDPTGTQNYLLAHTLVVDVQPGEPRPPREQLGG